MNTKRTPCAFKRRSTCPKAVLNCGLHHWHDPLWLDSSVHQRPKLSNFIKDLPS